MAKSDPIPQERAEELARSLTVGDVEYLFHQTASRLRKDERRPGNPAQALKIDRARQLRAKLVKALGYEPRSAPSGNEQKAVSA